MAKNAAGDVGAGDGQASDDEGRCCCLDENLFFSSPHFPALSANSQGNSQTVLFSHEMKVVESRTRVRYKETDQMGIAHHSNYIVWFEIGRTDLCRETGFSYRDIERRGSLLVVVEIGCRYRTPFRYDDEVVIRTSVREAASRSMTFSYELLDAADEVHATGFSKHLWLDRETRRPVKADAEVMHAFARFLPEHGSRGREVSRSRGV